MDDSKGKKKAKSGMTVPFQLTRASSSRDIVSQDQLNPQRRSRESSRTASQSNRESATFFSPEQKCYCETYENPTDTDGPPQPPAVCAKMKCDSDSLLQRILGKGFPKMADDLPIIPKANTIYIHSGNIINWNRLKRKPNLSSTDELCEIISNSLESYIQSSDKEHLQYQTEVYKVDAENVQTVEENERGDVKITVKLIVNASQPPSVIGDAVNKVLHELGTTFIETLLLAISRGSGEEDDQEEGVNARIIQQYWQAMEELVSQDKVLSLGVCDLSKNALEALYEWAKVKPCVNQVNLESCCVMPQDLTEYAKAINIQLLTHNDSPEFLTKERLQETIQSVSTERDSDAWAPEWIARYSGLIKCRGIIKMKGYVFHATRDNRKRIL